MSLIETLKIYAEVASENSARAEKVCQETDRFNFAVVINDCGLRIADCGLRLRIAVADCSCGLRIAIADRRCSFATSIENCSVINRKSAIGNRQSFGSDPQFAIRIPQLLSDPFRAYRLIV
jgi:hypothetical protein